MTVRQVPQQMRGAVEAWIEKEVEEEAMLPFDMGTPPLLRAVVLVIAKDEHVLLCTTHHIVSDGWSIGVLMVELTSLYADYCAGRPTSLPPLAIQYSTYSKGQRQKMQGETLRKHLEYWREALRDLPMVQLPLDRRRPSVATYRGLSVQNTLPLRLRDALRQMNGRESVTMFMALLAAFALLMKWYTGVDDIAVATTIANRTQKETESLIGLFVNTIILRIDLSGDPTFIQLLDRVRDRSLGAYQHQDLPFEKLVEELQPDRNLQATPLAQVSFTLHNMPVTTMLLSGLRVSRFPIRHIRAKYDLAVHVADDGESVAVEIEFNSDVFDKATIQRLSKNYLNVVEVAATQPAAQLSELTSYYDSERQQLIDDFNALLGKSRQRPPRRLSARRKIRPQRPEDD